MRHYDQNYRNSKQKIVSLRLSSGIVIIGNQNELCITMADIILISSVGGTNVMSGCGGSVYYNL